MPDILLATDIFGHTPELQTLANDLARGLDMRVRIFSPYGPERPRFASEVEAYAAFCARTSLEAYAADLSKALEARFDLALGFSVGATALWIALARQAFASATQAELYYGSRIRNFQHLRQTKDVRLIFAERETGFDPAALVAHMQAQGLVAKLLPGTAHGFMNRLSAGFDAAAYAAEIRRLRTLLR